MTRLSLSNINPDVIQRLEQECSIADMSYNKFVSNALEHEFSRIDEDRNQKEPIPPVEFDPELYEVERRKAVVEKQYLLAQKELEAIEFEKKFDRKSLDNFELLKMIDAFLKNYDGCSIVKVVGQVYLVEQMIKHYGFEIDHVEHSNDRISVCTRYLKPVAVKNRK
jgi:hypothetical protein